MNLKRTQTPRGMGRKKIKKDRTYTLKVKEGKKRKTLYEKAPIYPINLKAKNEKSGVTLED